MRIAPYYQKLLEDALQAAKSLEPITFTGMFDSATGYLFTLATPLFQAELEKDIKPMFVDLSGLTTQAAITQELAFALSDIFPDLGQKEDYFSLTKRIVVNTPKHKMVLILYLGQDGDTDLGLLQFLNRLRNLLGWNFSYIVYVTSRLIFSEKYASPLVDKVLKRNLFHVLPLDRQNAEVVLNNYRERYKKDITQKQGDEILSLSGGNPGIVKALYLQASENREWTKPDLLEEVLYIRLREIAADLPENYKKVLLSGTRTIVTRHIYDQLARYGYSVKKGTATCPFTTLLKEYLVKYANHTPRVKIATRIDQELLHMTRSQRLVFGCLKERAGELVTKDDIAKVLWGEAWADHYSDWAIDQLISTLREKILAIKHEGKIVTKKGEGIVFLPT